MIQVDHTYRRIDHAYESYRSYLQDGRLYLRANINVLYRGLSKMHSFTTHEYIDNLDFIISRENVNGLYGHIKLFALLITYSDWVLLLLTLQKLFSNRDLNRPSL